MKFLVNLFRSGRAAPTEPAAPSSSTTLGGDDTLGRGMDLALTVLAFLIIGWLIDSWLGLFPVFTISLVVFAAIGTFIRMKYTYDARMERLEAERRAVTGIDGHGFQWPAAAESTEPVEGSA